MEVTQVSQPSRGIIFPQSPLAHKYLDGGKSGIEIGAAAHNPFGLEDCLNVADELGFEFYKTSQHLMCAAHVEADIFADAANIPLEDQSLDYVINSHMIEHHPDPIWCLHEWARLVKEGGIIFIIFPKRDALPDDRERPVSTLDEILRGFHEKLTVETAPEVPGQGKGGHYYVYTLNLMLQVIAEYNLMEFDTRFEIADALETDDKVGNGHCIVLRVHHVEREPAPEVDSDPLDALIEPAPDYVLEGDPLPAQRPLVADAVIHDSNGYAVSDVSVPTQKVSPPKPKSGGGNKKKQTQ